MQLHQKIIVHSIIMSSLLTLSACGGGGGAGSSTNGSGDGNTGALNIKSVATLDSLLNSSYTPACIYQYGGTTYLVKNDNSGTGVGLTLNSGQTTNLSNLPKISSANGDVCMVNFGQLTWYNKSNTSIVHVFDPTTQSTQTIDLSHTGFTGSAISQTSFDLDVGNKMLYANRTFLDDGYIGFVKFDLSQNPITTFSQLDSSSYSRIANPVLFGFWGLGSGYIQMYQPSNTLPAIIVSTVLQGGITQQNVLSITDGNNQAIPAMATSTDWVNTSQGIMVVTGAVQPVLYGCPRSATVAMNFSCNKTYTGSELTSSYRIVKLLGSNASQVYFMGIDLTQASMNIFALPL